MGAVGRRRLRLLKDEVRGHVEQAIATNADPQDAEGCASSSTNCRTPAVEAEFGDHAIGLIVLNTCRDIRHWSDAMLPVAIDPDNRARGLPPQFPAARRGPEPAVEKLPTGMIGTPDVPPAIDLPPWSVRPPPDVPPAIDRGRDPPPAHRRPPGAYPSR